MNDDIWTVERDAEGNIFSANNRMIEGLEVVPADSEELLVFLKGTVVYTCSRAQAIMALYEAGFLDAVETAMQAASKRTQIWYKEANVWQSDNPYVWAFASELGLSDDAVISLFKAAERL